MFLIPSNKLNEGINWLNQRLNLIKIEGNRVIQHFESWNADSIYFLDGAGNIGEFIVRYDLKNETNKPFNISHIISVNEIGMPTNDVKAINKQLEHELNLKFWKGNLERFATNGTQDGLFLLVNNEIKDKWFPTDLFPQSSPFEAKVEVKNKEFDISFRNSKLTTRSLIT